MSKYQGLRIGKYELAHQLGKGSMGVVHLAYDAFAGREVAVKLALPEALKDPENGPRYRKLFFNEARVAGSLTHPNIVRVYDAGVQDDICFIVMEYVQGGLSLGDYCTPDSLLPPEEVVRIIFKCARALDYAHKHGVVHRDVKPRNVMLTEEFEVKLGDFSTALSTDADNYDTQVLGYVGSPLYMSPEQLTEEIATAQSDLFSLGVVFYQMLTGKHPFRANSLSALIKNVTGQKHAAPEMHRPDLPPVVSHIVDRALAKKPRSRYRTALDFAADLSLVFDHTELFKEEVSSKEKFKLVQDLKFFQDFSEPETWELVNACAWMNYQAGTRIIIEGETDNSFYVIVAGEVSVRKRDVFIDRLGEGDCFGEMGFIARSRRVATVVAESNVTALRVRASVIDRASLNCQLRFHRVFLTTMVNRLSLATDMLSYAKQKLGPEVDALVASATVDGGSSTAGTALDPGRGEPLTRETLEELEQAAGPRNDDDISQALDTSDAPAIASAIGTGSETDEQPESDTMHAASQTRTQPHTQVQTQTRADASTDGNTASVTVAPRGGADTNQFRERSPLSGDQAVLRDAFGDGTDRGR